MYVTFSRMLKKQHKIAVEMNPKIGQDGSRWLQVGSKLAHVGPKLCYVGAMLAYVGASWSHVKTAWRLKKLFLKNLKETLFFTVFVSPNINLSEIEREARFVFFCACALVKLKSAHVPILDVSP